MNYLTELIATRRTILIFTNFIEIVSIIISNFIVKPKYYGFQESVYGNTLGLFVILERHLYSTIDDKISFHNEQK